MSPELSRRSFLGGGAAGLALGGLGGFAGAKATTDPEPIGVAGETIEARGPRQAGIATVETNFANLVAFRVSAGGSENMARLMRLWSDNIVRLTAGQPSLTDTEPELATNPSKLTITVGIGPGFFVGDLENRKPAWLTQLPAYPIDDLRDEWSGGDIALLIACEDPLTLSHAQRVMIREAQDFTEVAWVQTGFRNTAATAKEGATPRNLFGQIDGSINPDPETEPELVFRTGGEEWMVDGTTLVVRRIAMNLDTWDELDRPAREVVIGRDLATGAPLTGGSEKDPIDLEAVNSLGFPRIDLAAHARRAQTGDTSQRIYRRPYNYDLNLTGESRQTGQLANAGQVFLSFQADIDHQFKPIQEKLAEMDLLNQWTVPIGSSVFAIPPGFGAGNRDYLLQDLLG